MAEDRHIYGEINSKTPFLLDLRAARETGASRCFPHLYGIRRIKRGPVASRSLR